MPPGRRSGRRRNQAKSPPPPQPSAAPAPPPSPSPPAPLNLRPLQETLTTVSTSSPVPPAPPTMAGPPAQGSSTSARRTRSRGTTFSVSGTLPLNQTVPTRRQPSAGNTSSTPPQLPPPHNTRQQAASSSSTSRPGPSAWQAHQSLACRIASVSSDRIAAEQKMKDLFLHFLNNSTKAGHKCAFYKSVVHAMSIRGDFDLQVNFNHLLRPDYMELAKRVANDNDRSHAWLRPTAVQYLIDEGFDAPQEEIANKLSIQFTGKPDGMHSLNEFLQANKEKIRHPLKILDEDVVAACYIGRSTYSSLVHHVLARHEQDLSWDGNFTSENVFVLQTQGSFQCVVFKDLSAATPAPATSKAKDLHAIGEMMRPYFHGVIFFNILDDDLSNATAEQARTRWFAEYLRYHVAFMSSASRRNLITQLHAACALFQQGQLGNDARLEEILVHALPVDWRKTIRASRYQVLIGLFEYDPIEQAILSLGIQPAAVQIPHAKHPSQKYINSFDSVLKYHRHALEHLHQHIARANAQRKIVEFDEVELYAAQTIPCYLPELLRRLLQKGSGTPPKAFGSAWSTYKASSKDNYDMPRFK